MDNIPSIPPGEPQLVVKQHLTDKGLLVEAVGELDGTTEGGLRDLLTVATGNREQQTIILDLTQVDFLDSTGLRLLASTQRRLSPQKRTLVVVLAPGSQPERVLKIGRFDKVLTFVYSRGDLP